MFANLENYLAKVGLLEVDPLCLCLNALFVTSTRQAYYF